MQYIKRKDTRSSVQIWFLGLLDIALLGRASVPKLDESRTPDARNVAPVRQVIEGAVTAV